MRRRFLMAVAAAGCSFSAGAQLIVGSDNEQSGLWAYEADSGEWISVLSGEGSVAWGMAADEANENLYATDGLLLYRIPYLTLRPTLVGPILPGGHMAGLAWADGVLLGVRNVAPEGLFVIDPTSALSYELFSIDEAFNFGGLDYDPVSGFVYATSDGKVLAGPGMYRIDPASQVITAVRTYPKFKGKGVTHPDVDGLALDGAGHAFLVIDEPGDVCVVSMAASSYQTPFSTPFDQSEIYSGAAWSPRLVRRLTCQVDLSGSALASDPGYGHPDFQVNADDLAYFLDQWTANNADVADLTHTESNDDAGYGVPNGVVDEYDWMYFIDHFALGCP